jgi:hypothetical protein
MHVASSNRSAHRDRRDRGDRRAATDAVYVMFTAAVSARRRLPAASWSSVWYLLSSFAVISYTSNWVYVCFAAVGSWIGAYLSMTFLHRTPSHPPPPLAPMAD